MSVRKVMASAVKVSDIVTLTRAQKAVLAGLHYADGRAHYLWGSEVLTAKKLAKLGLVTVEDEWKDRSTDAQLTKRLRAEWRCPRESSERWFVRLTRIGAVIANRLEAPEADVDVHGAKGS